MKISRNAPCPCGSGKKYKRCCGADIQPYEEPTQKGNWAEQLTQAIQASGASTIEEMNALAQSFSADRNERPIQEFLGLSPTHMSSLLYQPFDSPDVVIFNSDWFPEKARALHLFDALARGIGSAGIKASGQGNLPIQLCRDILVNTPEGVIFRPAGIRSEVEFDELHCIRVVSELAGLIEHRKKHFHLTEQGHALTRPEQRNRLFHSLFKAYATEFNWACRDAYPDVDIIQTAWLFSLYCLSIFGQQWRPFHFYAEKFLQAFPMALDEMAHEDDRYFSPEQEYRACYGLRTLNRFAEFWGLAEVRKIKSSEYYAFDYELQAPQLSQWLTFSC